jgi:hypothetical protein
MEKLASSGAIDAHLVNLGRILAHIFDVTQDMTAAVL